MVSFGLGMGALSLAETYRQAKLAEKHGLDSLWFEDHLLLTGLRLGKDVVVAEVWTTLTAIAMKTKRIKLACTVTDPFRRHPAQTAQAAATLDQISKGRTILGIGGGESMNLIPFGIKYEKPLGRLREAVEVIKLLSEASCDKPAEYSGEFFQLKKAFLQILPFQKPRYSIYIGALGPKSRELTGEIADGWVPWLHTPETLRKGLEDVERGAKKVGRSLKEFDVAVHVPMAIVSSAKELKEIKQGVKRGLVLERRTLLSMGYDVPEELSIQKALPTMEYYMLIQEASRNVPDEAVDEVSAIGSVDDCINKIEKYIEAGATTIVIENRDPKFENTLKLLEEKIKPHFTNSKIA